MQMQTGVTTTEREHSSLDHRGYDPERGFDPGSGYNDSTSSDDEEPDYIGSDKDDADQASAVYLNREYAETDEINNAFGDGRYVVSPDGSLVAHRDLGPLDSLHARAAPKIRAWRQAEAAVIGRVSDGANGMARAIKRMLEKAGAKLASVLTSNESEEDEPAVEVRIHEMAEGAREYERRVLATCCMNHQVSERRNTI
ncbi:hypothetical protein DBV05_g7289 [Lasiodiplodia theobromae]|uniref:Uncharacterized protein n=1 Tax=Lasiodiplodia theobromae TaxID=45133 RepID=A0A5N5D871_9PEZI|nr:hypothetical protein DBV05_g7289 [Lasiodiplodia theobromae]